jgi:hypothetical protein
MLSRAVGVNGTEKNTPLNKNRAYQCHRFAGGARSALVPRRILSILLLRNFSIVFLCQALGLKPLFSVLVKNVRIWDESIARMPPSPVYLFSVTFYKAMRASL